MGVGRGGDHDVVSDIVNGNLADFSAQLGIFHFNIAILCNVLAAHSDAYLHGEVLILQLERSCKGLVHQGGTGSTFHGYHTIQNKGNIFVIPKEAAMLANLCYESVGEHFHTLEIGMQPVFHQILKALGIRLKTTLFEINKSRLKVGSHLTNIFVKCRGLLLIGLKGQDVHHIQLRIRISLLHLMEGNRISLHRGRRILISEASVAIRHYQLAKINSFISTKVGCDHTTVCIKRRHTGNAFYMFEVIGAHVNDDDIRLLTAIFSHIIVELNSAIFPHSGSTVLIEMDSTAGPGVIDKNFGSQFLRSLIDPDLRCLLNFAYGIDCISFRVLSTHGEPYSTAGQGVVCRLGSSAV